MGLLDDIMRVITGNDGRRVGLSPDSPTVSQVSGGIANAVSEYSGVPSVERIVTGKGSVGDYVSSVLGVAGPLHAIALGKPGYWKALTGATKGEYRVSPLSNGLMRVQHGPSGLVGVFEQGGARRSGMIRLPHNIDPPTAPAQSDPSAWGLHVFGDGPDAGWQGTYTSRAAAEAAKKQIPGERTGSRILKRKYK